MFLQLGIIPSPLFLEAVVVPSIVQGRIPWCMPIHLHSVTIGTEVVNKQPHMLQFVQKRPGFVHIADLIVHEPSDPENDIVFRFLSISVNLTITLA